LLLTAHERSLPVTEANELSQRLVAILAADVAGYSRLMAEDERATVAALDAARALFRSQIEGNRGRVVDMAGRQVSTISKQRWQPGNWAVQWDGRGADGRSVSAGVYFVQMELDGRPLGQQRLALVR